MPRLWFWLLLTASCADGIVRLDLPVLEATRSIVLGVEYEGLFEVTAFELDAPGALPVIDPLEHQARLTAALYDEALAEKGLQPGKLVHEEDPLRARPLEPPDALFEALVTSEAHEWRAIEEPSSTFAAFRRTVPVCDRLRASLVDPPITESVNALARLRDGNVLAISKEKNMYLIDLSGASTRMNVELPGRFTPRAAVQLGSGELWISGEDGKVRRGNLIDGFVAADTPTTTADLWAIDGTRDGGELEVFTLGNNGAYFRFYGGRWEQLRSGKAGPRAEQTSVAWIRSGVAIGTTNILSAILYYDAGASSEKFREEMLEFRYGDGTVVEHIEGYGTILTTQIDRVLKLTGGLEGLAYAPIRDTYTAVVPYRDDFVAVGNAGSLFQFQQSDVECPVIDVSAPLVAFTTAEQLDATTFVIAGSQRESPTDQTVFIVRPE